MIAKPVQVAMRKAGQKNLGALSATAALHAITLLLLLGWPRHADAADTPTTHAVEYNGHMFRFATPDGFCLPDKAFEPAIQEYAALDPKLKPLLFVIDCAANRTITEPAQWIVIKARRDADSRPGKSRETLLQELRSVLDDGTFASIVRDVNEGDGAYAERLSQYFGTRVRTHINIEPISIDDKAFYTAALGEIRADDGTDSTYMVAATTAIHETEIYYYWHEALPDTGSLIERLTRLKAVVEESIALSEGK